MCHSFRDIRGHNETVSFVMRNRHARSTNENLSSWLMQEETTDTFVRQSREKFKLKGRSWRTRDKACPYPVTVVCVWTQIYFKSRGKEKLVKKEINSQSSSYLRAPTVKRSTTGESLPASGPVKQKKNKIKDGALEMDFFLFICFIAKKFLIWDFF